jgi:hypothetical protein
VCVVGVCVCLFIKKNRLITSLPYALAAGYGDKLNRQSLHFIFFQFDSHHHHRSLASLCVFIQKAIMGWDAIMRVFITYFITLFIFFSSSFSSVITFKHIFSLKLNGVIEREKKSINRVRCGVKLFWHTLDDNKNNFYCRSLKTEWVERAWYGMAWHGGGLIGGRRLMKIIFIAQEMHNSE